MPNTRSHPGGGAEGRVQLAGGNAAKAKLLSGRLQRRPGADPDPGGIPQITPPRLTVVGEVPPPHGGRGPNSQASSSNSRLYSRQYVALPRRGPQADRQSCRRAARPGDTAP